MRPPPLLGSPSNGDSNSSSSSEVSSRADRRIDQFSVELTAKFLLATFLLCTAMSFFVGVMSHIILLSRITLHPVLYQNNTPTIKPERNVLLPSIRAINGDIDDVPLTTFTTKLFPQKAVTASCTVQLDRRDSVHDESSVANHNFQSKHSCFEDKDEEEHKEKADLEELELDSEIHLPAGQHFLVDIRGVDSNFLNSQELLAQAMVDLTLESGVTLLSYHCHSILPMGVSCTGIFLSSHVSLHTWPSEGIIMIDVFTSGVASVIPILQTIKRLFALSGNDDVHTEPRILWSHKLRGFREGFSAEYDPHENPLEQDLGSVLMSMHNYDLKIQLVSDETDFQHVDIYKIIDPSINSLLSYERSLTNDGSYESLHPDLYRPDKILFLDGVHQSTLYGESSYHEALVHPAMIAHPNPKRVAIIGGGEGATLREVLKHKSVEEAVMVEIDGELVEMCREHLPEMSDCGDLDGSDASSCFDDSRATVIFDDAFKYFIDTFGDRAENSTQKFDVIVMDALDPDRFAAIVGSLYKSNEFVASLLNGLSDEGVFVVQMGEADSRSDPNNEVGAFKDTAHMMEELEHRFSSMHIYDEGHSHFQAPWSYVVCFKDFKSRSSWYKTQAELEIEVKRRIHGTKSGKPPLLHFDAPTMASYQLPPKSDEITYCRKINTPEECEEEYHGIDSTHIDPVIQLESILKNDTEPYVMSKVYSPIVERHLRQIIWQI